MEGDYRSFQLPESRTHYPPSRDFHTEHVKIELELDFKTKRISGVCTLTILPLGKELSGIRLDACGMEIGRVSVDGVQIPFEYDGETLAVHLATALRGKASVQVAYSSAPSEGVYFTGPDDGHPEREVQAWSHNQADFARYWFPCFDHPNEKSTSEIVLKVPKEFRVISNGSLLSVKEEGPAAIYHWKEDLPHSSYLTSFVAGKFGEITAEVDGVHLAYYFPERMRPDVLRYFGETPRMIEVFGSLTGVKYPYSKYSQTTVEDFIYGGMENFNATTLATTYYPDEASEEDFQTSYAAPQTNAVSLVAHELAHQWFGDLTTCVDWSQAWLNEGFATYFQGLYLEKTRGVDHFRWDLGLRAEQFLDEDALDYRRPIVEKSYVFPDDVFDYTTYEKGAWMLHELRYLMGDDAFFRGITEFLNANAFASVDTHDLRKAMEKASGLSLEEFFDQAFFKPGFPEFEVEYEWDDAGKTAAVRVKQTQKMESGTPAFKLPCDIVFYVEGKRMEWRVGLNGAEQAFAIKLPSMPSIVEFDPRRWLLKKVAFRKSLKLLLNQLESSEDASSRADAAKALGVSKADAAVAGLKKAAVKEQFWDVRASALRALGAIGTPAALEALLEVGLPGNRRERRGLAEALGFFRDKRARETLVELLESDASPYVRCEAALSLGKAWPEDILPVLKKAMGVHSPNETLAEACLDAMGSINDKEVGGIVADCLRYGKPTRVRIGALKAIKRRGALLDGELPKLKEVLLKDKEFRVRQYLVAKLVPAIGDRRFLESLGEAAKTDRDPRIRRRALEALHRMSDTREVSHEISVLKAQVEQLKGESKVRPQPASTS